MEKRSEKKLHLEGKRQEAKQGQVQGIIFLKENQTTRASGPLGRSGREEE